LIFEYIIMEIFFHTIKIEEFKIPITFQSIKRYLSFEEYIEVYQYFLKQLEENDK
jgi:hypothetical protein